MMNNPYIKYLVGLLCFVMVAACSVGKNGYAVLALKDSLLLNETYTLPTQYTKEYQPVTNNWRVKVSHAEWVKNGNTLESKYTSGHMPVITYEGNFVNTIIELEFRFFEEEGKWAACRISATNPTLNPRAYAVSVWANQNNKARANGMVLEHDEWKPGTITTVNNAAATWQSGKWYTIRLEIMGNYAKATCNGVTVFGIHEKFGIPKTHIYLGVGTCKHQIRNFKVYKAIENTNWKPQTINITK